MANELLLRDVVSGDLPIFFEQQLNKEANYMAAFTAKDPTNWQIPAFEHDPHPAHLRLTPLTINT